LPRVRELVADPQKIWVTFERHQRTDKIRVRRRYVSLVDIGGDKVLAAVAEAVAGNWVDISLVIQSITRAKLDAGVLTPRRRGLRVWRSGEEE
jgi:hypothetical protein